MPKVQTFDFEVDGAAAQVAGELRSRLVGASLEGSVDGSSFELSPTPKRFSGRVRPVATGRLEQAGPGRTRVVGRCGTPALAVWYFRIATIAVPILLGWMAWSAGAMGIVGLPMIGFAVVMLTMMTVGIGFNIWSSDAQVAPLVDAIQRACGAVPELRAQATRQAE